MAAANAIIKTIGVAITPITSQMMSNMVSIYSPWLVIEVAIALSLVEALRLCVVDFEI